MCVSPYSHLPFYLNLRDPIIFHSLMIKLFLFYFCLSIFFLSTWLSFFLCNILVICYLYFVFKYYMKTGICKFGNSCKFHHPIDRSAPTASAIESPQHNVKLTLAGLPRREVYFDI